MGWFVNIGSLAVDMRALAFYLVGLLVMEKLTPETPIFRLIGEASWGLVQLAFQFLRYLVVG